MPIIVIWGDDKPKCDSEVEKIITQNVSQTWRNLNTGKFNGDESNQVSQALDEVQIPPLGDGSRVILIKNNPIFNIKDELLQKKFEFITQNIPESCFLILQSIQKPDSRIKTTKFFKKLIDDNKVKEINYKLPDIWDREKQIEYIENICKDLNIKLDNGASQTIIESIGLDTTRLKNELEKVSLYLSAKQNNEDEMVISSDHIREIFNDQQSNIFKIINLLLKNDIHQSLVEINNLLNKGEPPLRLTAGLTSQLRMYTIVFLLNNEQDIGKISKIAGIANPKRLFYIRKNVKHCSAKFLINMMIKLLNIESSLKKGNNPLNVFTENLMSLTE
tara:strand:+ start:2205 stop:3200 length:996 start_codon:yes stop_codon:yes gene_type:complete